MKRSLYLLLLSILAPLVAIGCGENGARPAATVTVPNLATSAATEPGNGQSQGVAVAEAGAQPRPAQQPASAAQSETWDSLYLNNDKAGYVHTTVTPREEDGKRLIEVTTETELSMKRFGQGLQMSMTMTSFETPDGDLVRFDTRVENSVGAARGWVEGDQLIVETQSPLGKGKAVRQSLDWPDDVMGFAGEERMLRENPLKPGDRRTFKTFVPISNQIADVALVAGDYEDVKLLDRTSRLLKITITNSATPGIPTIAWVNDEGESLKGITNMGFLQMTNYRTSRAEALNVGDDQAAADLGVDTLVRVERPIQNAHDTKSVTYRVTVEDADPSELFAVGPTQSIKKLGPETIELQVRASTLASAADAAPPATTAKNVPSEYLESNGLIESDDPQIVELAREAAGAAEQPWEAAQRLERWVYENLTEKNFSRAFSSAAQVAREREGDCTEHAVLLAALARARGIPARVAMGLVYVERAQAFAYHMWTEVYVGGRWIALDGTLGRGRVGAAHIKLSDSSLAGVSVVDEFLKVLPVLGRTKIEVLDVQS